MAGIRNNALWTRFGDFSGDRRTPPADHASAFIPRTSGSNCSPSARQNGRFNHGLLVSRTSGSRHNLLAVVDRDRA